MKTLANNAINTWGNNGSSWFNQLPRVIAQLSDYWDLSDIKPTDNMSHNYVAKAIQKGNKSVVLKIGCNQHLIEDEYRALTHFNGKGSVRVLDIHNDLNALLLEQVTPGYLLNEQHPKDIEDTIKIYSGVAKALASHPRPSNEYAPVNKWCQAIDRIHDERIESCFIDKAKELKTFLLSSAENEYICHGDLHLKNIINHGNKWLSIDPIGIIGEMAFEASAFDLINKNEWSKPETIQEKIINRVNLLASALEVNKDRLLAWLFLRVIISAQWFIENNSKPDEMLNSASNIYPLLTRQVTIQLLSSISSAFS